MDIILRSLIIYLVLLVIFRISGKRTLAQITTFDFVLLLIVGEATQQGLLGDDYSVTNALLVVLTLISADVAMSLAKRRWKTLDRAADGLPLLILEGGQPIEDRMREARVDESDILSAARQLQGLERLDQIKYAVLERSGSISIIPKG